MEEVSRDSTYFPNTNHKHRFQSSLLTGEYEKPWLKDPVFKKTKWNNVIVGIFFVLGFAGAAGIAFLLTYNYKQLDVSQHAHAHWDRPCLQWSLTCCLSIVSS